MNDPAMDFNSAAGSFSIFNFQFSIFNFSSACHLKVIFHDPEVHVTVNAAGGFDRDGFAAVILDKFCRICYDCFGALAPLRVIYINGRRLVPLISERVCVLSRFVLGG